MTNTIKRTITLILTVAMFAIMSTSAFASVTVEDAATKIGYTLFNTDVNHGIGLAMPLGHHCNAGGPIVYNPDGTIQSINAIDSAAAQRMVYMTGIIPSNFAEVATNSEIWAKTHTDRHYDYVSIPQVQAVLQAINTIDNHLFTTPTPIVKFDTETTTKRDSVGNYYEAILDNSKREITREEFAIILANACKYSGYTGNPNATKTVFPDADKFLTADGKAAAQFCIDNGLMHYEGHYEKFIDYASITPEMIARNTDGMGKTYWSRFEQKRWVENTDGKFNPQGTLTEEEYNKAMDKLCETLKTVEMTPEMAAREAAIKTNQI